MGVLVAGTDPDPPDLGRSRRPASPAVGVVLAAVALGLIALPTSPGADQATSPERRPGVALTDSGRWIPWSQSTVLAFDATRLGDRYLIPVAGTIESLGADGVTRSEVLPGVEFVRGVSSDGEHAVAFGMDERGPALWLTAGEDVWTRVRLPWQGTVQAAAISDGAVTLIGVDDTRARRIVAKWSGTAGTGWRVLESGAPDAALLPVEGGFVARGRIADGPVQYLISRDGLTWEPFATRIVNTVGEVAAIVETGSGDVVQIPGDDRLIRPPEWPIAALWRVGDRIWIQTPTAAWWSTDGTRWTRLALDRRHGIRAGAPVLLPFTDRAAVSVGGTVGSPQDIYMWILGT